MKRGKLKELCLVIAGQSPKGSAYNDRGDGMEFHQGKKAFGDFYLTHSNIWTTEISKIAEPLDILMSVRAPVGPTNITDRQICIGRGLAAIRCKDNVSHKFILYALRNIESKIVGNDGAVFNSINKAQIEALPVPIIPLPEQECIVSLLDAEFAKIDAIKANAEKQLQDAKALFQSALKDYLTPKEGWSESTIKDLCDVTKNIKWDESCGVRKYIDLTSVSRDSLSVHSPIEINFESAPSRAKQIVQTNDILFATTRPTLRRVCIVPEELNNNICSTGFCVLRSKSNLYHNFLFYNLLSDDFYQYIEPLQTGASYPAVTDKIVKGYKIFIPNYEEQQEIAKQLDSISQKIQSLQSNFDTTVNYCNDLKQSILKDIFG